jgi:hypothetical protein
MGGKPEALAGMGAGAGAEAGKAGRAGVPLTEVTTPHCPKQAIYVSLELEGWLGMD